jgi:hypothetical protein
MTRNAQARTKRLSVIIIGSAAILLFAPSAAWAGSGHNDYDRHRTRDHYWSQSAYHHDTSHKRHHRASHKRHPRGKLRGYEKHHVGYYCRPCDRYFRARGGLYDHVAYRHRVPNRHLEVAVDFGEFGWIFFGG